MLSSTKQYLTSSVMASRTRDCPSLPRRDGARDDITIGDHSDQTIILADRQEADILFRHPLGDLFQRVVRAGELDVAGHAAGRQGGLRPQPSAGRARPQLVPVSVPDNSPAVSCREPDTHRSTKLPVGGPFCELLR